MRYNKKVVKVYFTSTVKAKKKLESNFRLIYEAIEKLGHKNVSSFLLDVDPESFYSRPGRTAQGSYKEMVKKIKVADVVVFEITVPSLGIGYLVNLVLDMGKPVVLLHTKESSPYLFQFVRNEKLQIYEYDRGNIKKVLSSALEVAHESSSVRFTFFVTPKILQFFDWIAKKKKIPRAVYLRRLIEEAIRREKFHPKNPF